MNDIPAPIINVTAGVIATCLVALLLWSIRQVGSAAQVVSTAATLRQTLADQSALILAQERRIADLESCRADDARRIADLEALVRQAQLLEEIRPAKRLAAAHPPMAGG